MNVYVDSRGRSNCNDSNELTRLVNAFEGFVTTGGPNGPCLDPVAFGNAIDEAAVAQDALTQLTDARIVGKEFAEKARKLLKEGKPLEAFEKLAELAAKGDKTAKKILDGYEAIRDAAQSHDWNNQNVGEKSLTVLNALDRAGLVDGDVGRALVAVNKGKDVLGDVVAYAKTGASREEVAEYAANALRGSGLLPKEAEKAIDIYNVGREIADGIDRNASVEANVSFAADTLATSGVLGKEFGTAVAAIDASVKLEGAIQETIDGKTGGADHIATAARALAGTGVFGKDVTQAVQKGGEIYDVSKSVLSLVKSPNLASGVGVIGAVARLTGNKELGAVADIASLGVAIAAGGPVGIALAALAVVNNVFGIDVLGPIAKGIGKVVGAVGDAVKGVGKAVKSVGKALGKIF